MRQKLFLKCSIFLSVSVLAISFTNCSQSSDSAGAQPGKEGTFLLPQAKNVLWVGAHPDDEVYVAPILAKLCLKQGAQCTLLVVTDGGKGNCLLPGGCSPSVAVVRAQEMKNSAAYFKATLEMSNLEDSPAGSPDGVIEAWNASIGGGTKLLDAATGFIKNLNPDLILTFDPRHGSSCHLDHRAVGRLVLAAVLQAGLPLSSVYMPQSYWKTGLSSPTQAWAGNAKIIPTDNLLRVFSASEVWSSIVDILSIHKSQFSPKENDFIDAFSRSPEEYKIVPLLNAQETQMADPRYQNLCPVNDARWPGQ